MRAPTSRRCRSLWTAPPLAALALALACGGSPAGGPGGRADDPAGGGTAVVAAASDITGINPLLDGSETFTGSILDMLYLQLFDEQPDFADGPPAFEPELASAWRWLEDGRTLDIELRPGVVWDDGVPVSADDVVWTWRLQTDDRLDWPYADLKRSILDVEALGPRRLRVSFAGDSLSRLADLNQGHIVPRHRWRELPLERWRGNGSWFLDNQVVNGPFRLAAWQPSEQLVLERNPAFFREGHPRLDRVVFRIVPEGHNRLSQLLAGSVDFVSQIPAREAARVAEHPDTRLEAYDAYQYNYIHWNLRRPALADVETRQALILAIDRQRLVEALLLGHARIASSPIVSTIWAHRADAGPWPHDPARARELLAAAGWRDADGDGLLERRGEPLRFELLTNGDNRIRTDATVMIQEDLRRVGVEARVRQLELTTMIGRLRTRDFDAVLSAFTVDTSLDLTYAFHSDSIEGGFNFGGYANPEVDRLIEAARSSRDIGEQGRLLAQIQAILHREQPFAFLWEPGRLSGVSNRLRGVRPSALDTYYRIEEWWLTAPEPGSD